MLRLVIKGLDVVVRLVVDDLVVFFFVAISAIIPIPSTVVSILDFPPLDIV